MSMFDSGSGLGPDGPSGPPLSVAPILPRGIGGKSVTVTGYINLALLGERLTLQLDGQYDQIVIQTACVNGAWPSGPTPVLSLKYSADGRRFDAPSSAVNISSATTTAGSSGEACTGQIIAAVEVTVVASSGRALVTITATKTT